MAGLLKLSLAALWRYPWRTGLLITAIALVIALPLLAQRVFTSWQATMYKRAEATPIIIGPQAGRLDLLLDGLFLRNSSNQLDQAQLKQATAGLDLNVLPLHLRHNIAGTTLVGTDLDYLAFRDLSCAQGQLFLRLGDCVLGSKLAETLALKPGDSLSSTPHGILDPSAGTTLRLRITGILAANGSIDDERAFCDLKTAWVLDGIGHGHVKTDASLNTQQRKDIDAEVSADLILRNEVDDTEAFHFHGDPNNFPLTAAIAVPKHPDEAILLHGRLADQHLGLQALDSRSVLKEVVAFTMRFGDFAAILLGMVMISAIMLIMLIALLASRLRAEEFATLAALGLRRREISAIIFCEWLVLLIFSALFAVIITILVEAMLLESLQSIVVTWQS